ncbi:MAG: hypothetical protein U0326_00895 [Polyangiales bacterium]
MPGVQSQPSSMLPLQRKSIMRPHTTGCGLPLPMHELHEPNSPVPSQRCMP